MIRADFARINRVVVKIGSALLTAGGQGLHRPAIAEWVEQIATLRARSIDVVLVSSGAVAEGMARLGWKTRPKLLHELQAAASVGQMGLVQAFEQQFARHHLQTAQVLLTHDDLSDRQRYLNARSTLLTLLQFSAVPVINENDAVATEEIRFGDNDTLGALVANLIAADLLIILTDQLGLFTADPSLHPDAELLEEVAVNDPRIDQMAGGSRSGLGRGGMSTKVRAARLAARSGAATVVASGRIPAVITQIIAGAPIGTFFRPNLAPLAARKQWLAGQLQSRGRLILDAGAVRVLRQAGKSLLAVGVRGVEGEFKRGDLVSCIDEAGSEVARGLVNYDSAETRLIAGHASSEFERLLGYCDEPELIHRDNLVVL